MKMKVKELIDLLASVRNKFRVTFVDYDIYSYLDGTEEEIICSVRSDYKKELFLNETILNAEVEKMGIKSKNEIVFELTDDWDKEKEDQITDVKIPSRILEVSITKNELGLADVEIKDLQENEMLDIIQYLCEYTGTEVIFDKDGKWSIPLDKDNEAGDDNGKS